MDVLQVGTQIQPIGRAKRVVELAFVFAALHGNGPEPRRILQCFAIGDAAVDPRAAKSDRNVVLRSGSEGPGIFDPVSVKR